MSTTCKFDKDVKPLKIVMKILVGTYWNKIVDSR